MWEGEEREVGGHGCMCVYRCGETYPFRIPKPHLPRRHAGILVQVRPRRVDDRDVVFLIAYAHAGNHTVPSSAPRSLYLIFASSLACIHAGEWKRVCVWVGTPSMEFALVNCAHSSTSSLGKASHVCSGVRRR